MLPRALTRVPPLKLEDKDEYEQLRKARLQQQQQQQDGQQQAPVGWQEDGSKQVEVKLRLPNRHAYDQLAAVLSPGNKATFQQENFFFDGAGRELAAQRAVMRLRFYDTDKRATITVKGKQILRDGIGTASEVEEEVAAAQVAGARAWLDDPNAMLAASPLLADLNKGFGIKQLTCLGGFLNARTEFEWESLLLELDETKYEWGTLYELECETADPEGARSRLEALLGGQGISYSYSQTSKFANFINKTLL